MQLPPRLHLVTFFVAEFQEAASSSLTESQSLIAGCTEFEKSRYLGQLTSQEFNRDKESDRIATKVRAGRKRPASRRYPPEIDAPFDMIG